MDRWFTRSRAHRIRAADRTRGGRGFEALEQRRVLALSGFVEDFVDDSNPNLGGFDTAEDRFHFVHSFSGNGFGLLNIQPHPQALLIIFPGDSPIPTIDEITFSLDIAPIKAVNLATLDFHFPFEAPFRSNSVVFTSDLGGQPIRSTSVPITADHLGLIRVTITSNQPLADGLPLGPITSIQIVAEQTFFVDDISVLVDLPESNTPPVAVDDFESVPPGFFGDYSVTVPGVLANDPPDPDGDPVTAQLVADATRGHVTLNADGSYTYSPFGDGLVRSDTFTYRLSDGHDLSNIATVNLIVANQPPVAIDDSRSMRLVSQSFGQFFGELTRETYLVSGPSVLANDTDHAGDTLSGPLFGPGAQGEITQVFPDGSMLYERQAASLSALPPFAGHDQVTYVTNDGLAVSNVAAVSLTAVPNSVPVAKDDSYTVLRNSVLNVSLALLGVIGGFLPTPPLGGIGNLAGADTDADGDSLTAAPVSMPTHGSLNLQADGRFTYTPDAGFLGEDTFRYRVSDGFLGGQSNVAAVTIHVISPDSDQDGILDSVEEQGPNGGDANNDGIADSGQANVVSLPNSADGRFVTLVGPPGAAFSHVAAVVPPTALPERVLSLVDFFSFELSGIAPGGSATVVATLPAGVNPNAYYKFGPTPTNAAPHWYLFDRDGPTGAEIVGNLAILHFVDGQRGDDDLAANGVIVEPGGPVLVQSSAVPSIESVVINDGHAQRSKINSITVTFDGAVTFDPGAFELIHESGLRIALDISATDVNGRTQAVLTFRGHGIIGGSLFNGEYTLVVNGDKIQNQAGVALDGDGDGAAGGHHRAEFFRRFGDSDGDDDVDRFDAQRFQSTFGRRRGDSRYLWYLDFEDDGRVSVVDLLAFTVASIVSPR
jgi:hypothetical protein